MCVSRSIDGLARCSRSPTPVWVGVTRRCPAAAISGCIFFHAHPADHAPWQTRKVDPMMFLVTPRLIVKTPSGQVLYTSPENFAIVIPGRTEDANLRCAIHIGESRDSGFAGFTRAPE